MESILEPPLIVFFRSLWVSGLATLLAVSWSIPLAYILAVSKREKPVVYVMDALVGVPTVLIGLLLYFLLSRRGPLGFLNLLYTPWAIVIGQSVLVTPLLVAVSYRILTAGVSSYMELALSLGATSRQAALIVFRESLSGLLSGVVMAFSKAIGELGVALVVGGNIKGSTRVISTSIALATSLGEYEYAVLLGLSLTLIIIGLSMIRVLVDAKWASK
ncbi:MAG: ABC transporter permease [Desulfurococcus sp.]|nr:ABC transporter permease [Desulfurococcus sp.]